MPCAIEAFVESSQAGTSTAIAGSVPGSIAWGTLSSTSPVPADTTPRAGLPAATIPTPRTSTAASVSATPTAPRRAPRPPSPSVSLRAKRPTSSAPDRGSGSSRSSSGRAAQMTTSPERSATLVLNSFVWGAIRNVLAIATRSPNTIRPTWPVGTVFGSVIMKNRKMRTSGEVTMTRQKSVPQTGENAQFATMQWPDAARTPMPIASDTQNVAASPSNRRRRVMSRPPVMITAYAASIGTSSVAHQKSSGSTRALPRTMNATTRPRFEGLKTCDPRYLMTYFDRSDNPATPAKMYQPYVLQGWSTGVPTTRRMSATPLPVSIALAGQTRARLP